MFLTIHFQIYSWWEINSRDVMIFFCMLSTENQDVMGGEGAAMMVPVGEPKLTHYLPSFRLLATLSIYSWCACVRVCERACVRAYGLLPAEFVIQATEECFHLKCLWLIHGHNWTGLPEHWSNEWVCTNHDVIVSSESIGLSGMCDFLLIPMWGRWEVHSPCGVRMLAGTSVKNTWNALNLTHSWI